MLLLLLNPAGSSCRRSNLAIAQGAGPQGMVGMGIGGVMAVGMLMAVVMAVVMAVSMVMAVVPHGQGHPVGLAGAGAFPLA